MLYIEAAFQYGMVLLVVLEVIIHGGAGEVGGNKILVSNGEDSILLDFGISFEKSSRYFGFPRPQPKSIDQLIQLGIIPKIDNIYSQGVESLSGNFDLDPEPPVDAVFISHGHLDHMGYISLLTRKLGIFMGECCRNILEARKATTWRKEFTTNYDGLDIKCFRSYQTIKVGGMSVTPIHVDHSIPGAYGFVVDTGEGIVVYTGDLRWHGETRLTDDFVKYVTERIGEVDLLITETTHVDYSGYTSEREVRDKLRSIMHTSDNDVIIDFSRADFDRFYSVYVASKDSERLLLVDLTEWIYLNHIAQCEGLMKRIPLEDIYVYLPKVSFSRSEKEFLRNLADSTPSKILVPDEIENKFKSRNRDIQSYDRLNKFIEDQRREGKYVTIVAPGRDIEKISRILRRGSIYILASSEPIGEESEIEFERLKNWFEEFGVPIYHIHASGHITPLDLKRMIERINPKNIIPVHGTRPKLLRNFVGEKKYRWILPEEGQKIIL